MWGAAWLLAAALAPAPPAFAGEIFVVADRRPVAAPDVAASVSALDGRELAALPAASLADALGLLPGVDVLFEAGARGGGAGRGWHLSVYRIDVADEIDFDPATFRYLNLGASRHRGFEAGADLVRRPGATLSAGWEWSRVSAAGPGGGLQLKNVPEHTLRLRGTVRLPAALELGVAARHLAGRHLDDEHRFGLGDATLVDLRVGRAFGAWRAHLDLTNLLDDEALWVGFAVPDARGLPVAYGFPVAPRAALVGVRWRRAADRRTSRSR